MSLVAAMNLNAELPSPNLCDRTIGCGLFQIRHGYSFHYAHTEQLYGVKYPNAAMVRFGAFRLGGVLSSSYGNLPLMVGV